MKLQTQADQGPYKAASLDIDHIYRTYNGELRRLARLKLGGDQATADDVIQDAFIRLSKSKNRYRTEDARFILYRIVRNLLVDKMRAKKVREKNHENIRLNYVTITDITPERTALGREALRIIEQAILSLPEKTQGIYVLSRMEGWSYKEIADHCGISISSVEKQMSKALSKIAEAVAAHQGE